MATAYRNKYAGTCNATGVPVAKGAGWVVPGDGDEWRLLSDAACRAEGHKQFGGSDRDAAKSAGKKGVTTGLSVADAMAKIFDDNEGRHAAGEQPWTDKQISEWMLSEFPWSTEDSRSPARVRMYRTCYNKGTHSFAGRGEPSRKSYRYDSAGKRVSNRKGAIDDETAPSPGMDEGRVREIAREEIAAADRPVIEVHFSKRRKIEVDSAGKHAAFVRVLKRVEAGLPVLLVGPTGSGKTHLARQVAVALGLAFTFNSMSEGVSEASLLGRMLPDEDGAWTYVEAPFVASYSRGGVHLLDEVDASDANLLVQVNAAIANGFLSLPFAGVDPIERHADSVIIAAANTFGHGADRQYVGRNQLDTATVNRFAMGTVEVEYDQGLERKIAEAIAGDGAEPMLRWAWDVRNAINVQRLRRVMSTRNIEDAAKLLAVGVGLDEVRAIYFQGWSPDEVRKVVK